MLLDAIGALLTFFVIDLSSLENNNNPRICIQFLKTKNSNSFA